MINKIISVALLMLCIFCCYKLVVHTFNMAYNNTFSLYPIIYLVATYVTLIVTNLMRDKIED